jgi:hypothetical protein
MKRFIITKEQLKEYIERKKSEKVFYNILECLHKNSKYLNESFSQKKVNQTVIDDYQRKGLITPLIYEMLIKYKIIESESIKKEFF